MTSLSSLAHTTATSAIGELVIHIFDPFSLYPPPGSFLARVSIPARKRQNAFRNQTGTSHSPGLLP